MAISRAADPWSMTVDRVGKRYERHSWVFRNATADISPGQVVAVSGADGSGKSTLLRILAGAARPTRGHVYGRPTVIGFVPGRFAGPPRMSAESYLTHLAGIRGLKSAAAHHAVTDLLDRFELTADRRAPMQQLGRGDTQKVGLAQALLAPPDLLLLDEPWTSLDEIGHVRLVELIREVAQFGAVVLTRHFHAIEPQLETVVYRLGGGRLERLESPENSGLQSILLTELDGARVWSIRPDTTSVVLRHVETDPEAHGRWRRLPGVESVDTKGEEVTLAVARAATDSVLLFALRRGWSVMRVGESQRIAADPGATGAPIAGPGMSTREPRP